MISQNGELIAKYNWDDDCRRNVYSASKSFTSAAVGIAQREGNVGPYLAGVLVQRRAGCDLVSYLMPRLFTPLGIRRPMWEQDPLGYTFGAGGLFLCVQELHKLGLLYLQDGNWNGKQLIPADWVRESTRKQVENDTPYGYGYLFWGDQHGAFRADGKYCQLSIIMRDKNAVVTTIAECRDADALREAIFTEIYPQL